MVNPFPGHDRMRGWLSIPYLGKGDRVLQLRFRCIAAHDCKEMGHGKYHTVAGDPARIFNVRAVHEAGDVLHVTEGEMDCITLSQVGLSAVALPGANSWSGHYRRVLAGFSRIYVWGDPDEAGAQFVNTITRAVRSARGVYLKGDDVNGIYEQHGADALLDLVDGGK